MKTETTIYDRKMTPQQPCDSQVASEAQEDGIAALACPERPGTVRRIHRLWKGASTTAYRVNWHQDDGGWGELGERRISASCFVTVSADGQVTVQA